MNKQHLIMSASILIVLLLAIAIYLFSIYLPSTVDTSPEEGLLKCNTLGSSVEGAINLLFFSKSETEVKEYADFFFKTPPYINYQNRFNIHYIDNYAPECDTYKGIATFCHSRTLLKRAASCPNDYVIVLVGGLSSSIRSSSYQKVVSLNTAHPLTVLTHEFAHTFANLADEYVPAGALPRGQHNCVSQCTNFQNIEDGCFNGCTDDSHIRSIDDGVMRTLSSNDYGSFNEHIVSKSIEEQSSEPTTPVTGRQTSEPSNSKCILVTFGPDGKPIRQEAVPGTCSEDAEPADLYTVHTDAPPESALEQTTDQQIVGSTEKALPEDLPETSLIIPVEEDATEVVVKTFDAAGIEQTTTVEVPKEEPKSKKAFESGVIERVVRKILPGETVVQQEQTEERTILEKITGTGLSRSPQKVGDLEKLSPISLGNTTSGNETNATTETQTSSPQVGFFTGPTTEQAGDGLGDGLITIKAISDLTDKTLPKVLIIILTATLVIFIIMTRKKRRGSGVAFAGGKVSK